VNDWESETRRERTWPDEERHGHADGDFRDDRPAQAPLAPPPIEPGADYRRGWLAVPPPLPSEASTSGRTSKSSLDGMDAPGALQPPPAPFTSFEVSPPSDSLIVGAAATAAAFRRLHVWKEELFAWVRTLLSAAVYATLIVTFGFQVARVEGESMAPTLEDQDRLIVNKLAYRLGAPRRGDIVMLYYPRDPDKSFVKRVIAEEGDVVKIEDGRVYVNDVPMDDSFVPPEYRSHEDEPPRQIRQGYYYVMGDHRNNSSDSRHWGEVPKKYIIGKVQLRWWPIPNATVF
jgi:signal peptidase I